MAKKIIRKKRPKRKSNLAKRWQKFKSILLQRIGYLTVFIVILLILVGLISFRFIQEEQKTYQLRQEEQALYDMREDFLVSLVPEAQRLQREYGLLASVSLAQAGLESDFGQSGLAQDYNNLYGVKTESSDPEGVDLSTMEYVDGEWIEIVDRFKVYDSYSESMRSHAELIYYGTTWDSDYYDEVLSASGYKEQAQALQQAGYATDPTYGDKLIEVIETWDLSQYDQPQE